MTGYIVQVHGEWSGRDDVIDQDFEAATIEEARAIIREEVPEGVIYVLQTTDGRTIEEGVGR
jgi:hypothetical protein